MSFSSCSKRRRDGSRTKNTCDGCSSNRYIFYLIKDKALPESSLTYV